MIKKYIFVLSLLGSFFLQYVNAQEDLKTSEYYQIVTSYIDLNQEEYGLTNGDYNDLYIKNEVYSKSSGLTQLYIVQRYKGIEIFNAISTVAIKQGKVFYFANNFLGNIQDRIKNSTPELSAKSAVVKAANQLKLGEVGEIEVEVSKKTSSSKNMVSFGKGNISKNAIHVQLVYQQIESELKLAWNLPINTTKDENWWSIRVDAISGKIISKNNWVVSCNFSNHEKSNNVLQPQKPKYVTPITKDVNNTMLMNTNFVEAQYNVLPLPIESPNYGKLNVVTNIEDPVASPFGWHDTDGIQGDEYTITRGNNVWAVDDTALNGFDNYSPDGTSILDFNIPINLNQNPFYYLDGAIVNLFYVNNMMHDIMYHYGFDEVSGNFQQTNYSGEGLANDAVDAQAQDDSGFNNANFATPSDGYSPTMQMFVFTKSGSTGTPLTINSGALAGDYVGLEGNQFGEFLTSTPLTADLALIKTSETDTDYESCSIPINDEELLGKIAVVRRGNCDFGYKATMAQLKGAIGLIVVNNVPDSILNMGGGNFSSIIEIPVIMIYQEDGENIISKIENGETLNASLTDAPPYEKDGDFENGIILHEYAHGVTTRLTGGASSSDCLKNKEQMGEGWSDWYGLMLTIQDTNAKDRGIGTYVLGQDADGLGIREVKYSPDFSVNNFTYGKTNDNTFLENFGFEWNQSVHNVGTVWGTILWDLSLKYIEKYGYDTDMKNGTGGNNKVLQVITESLKLQPCSPGFVDGRDAILAADIALTNGENQCLIWGVFAKRGLGYNASQGSSDDINDQIEDFTEPPSNDISLANCTSLSTSESELLKHRIYPNPAKESIKLIVDQNYENVSIKLFNVTGQVIFNHYYKQLETETTLNVSTLPAGIYILKITNSNMNFSEKIVIKE